MPHRGRRPPIWFWRDSAGREIDFLVERSSNLLAIEARSGETAPSSFFDGLIWWRRLLDDPDAPALLVYGGDESFTPRGIEAVSWRAV